MPIRFTKKTEALSQRDLLLALKRAVAGLVGARCTAADCHGGRVVPMDAVHVPGKRYPKCARCGGSGMAPGVVEILKELDQDFGVKAKPG